MMRDRIAALPLWPFVLLVFATAYGIIGACAVVIVLVIGLVTP